MVKIMWIVPAKSRSVSRCPYYTNNNQKKLPSRGDLTTKKHDHHNNEYSFDNNNKFNNNAKDTVSATHTQERSIDLFLFPHSNRSSNQYHYLSKILFFSNPSQPNRSSLLRTTRCGILFNHRITAFKQNLVFYLSHPQLVLQLVSLNWSFGFLLIRPLIYPHLINKKFTTSEELTGLHSVLP